MSVTAKVLVLDRAAPAEGHVATQDVAAGDGEVLLRVDRFALTSNNVTYAVLGAPLRYWDFFPTGDDATGTPPTWGFATVVESNHDEVAVGEQWYGFLPAATHVVVRPGRVDARGVTDASPHRQGLAGTYQRYERSAVDPLHDEATADLELLVRPLFTTSFLLDDQLADPAATGGAALASVVVTSASSKTGTALGHLLAARDGVAGIGLTSRRNVELVEALELFDRVLSYDELAGLAGLDGPAGLVDLAGNAEVVADVHAALTDDLATSLVVGVTHHGDTGAPPTDGPTPTMFFAPTRVKERLAEWGPAGFQQRVVDTWTPYVAWIADRLTVREVAGLDVAVGEWTSLVLGDIDPAEGIVVVPAEG